MLKKYIFILSFLFTTLSFSNDVAEESIIESLKTFNLLPPNRDLLSKERLLKNDINNIQITFSKGSGNDYCLHINKNEVNEKIFNLELFINTYQMDMKDAVRHHQIYNQEFFLIYHNQNGYFPINGNEYYLINESESKINELIADGHIHEFSKIEDHKYIKTVMALCKYKNKIYTIPHEMCK